MEFNTLQEYRAFLLEHDRLTTKIPILSSDTCEYIYLWRTKQVAYFNYNENKGWAASYAIARNKLASQGIELRNILTECTVGIQYSKSNYLEADDSLLMIMSISI